MPTQNLISATLSPEAKAEVVQKLADVKSRLNFLVSLNPAEIQSLVKAGNVLTPFVDLAHQVASEHPEILPGVFDLAEFRRDYALIKDLSQIESLLSQLTESVQNTLLAVNSDALTASLDVYAAVRQNRDKVPGLNVTADSMGVFFKRAKRKPEPASN